MKKAFSIIELIFLIVIFGILAVIAILKFLATREDAKVALELKLIANCINESATYYTALEKEDKSKIMACNEIKCANIEFGNNKDGIIKITLLNSQKTKLKYCDKVKEIGLQKDFNGIHKFGGTKIKVN